MILPQCSIHILTKKISIHRDKDINIKTLKSNFGLEATRNRNHFFSSPRPVNEKSQRLLATLGYSCLSLSLSVSRESFLVQSKRRWPANPRASSGVEWIFGFLHLHRTDEPCLEPEISFALEPRRSPWWWVSLPATWRDALPGRESRISWWTQLRLHGWLTCPTNFFQFHKSIVAHLAKLVNINCWHVSNVDVAWLWLAVVGRPTHEQKVSLSWLGSKKWITVTLV